MFKQLSKIQNDKTMDSKLPKMDEIIHLEEMKLNDMIEKSEIMLPNQLSFTHGVAGCKIKMEPSLKKQVTAWLPEKIFTFHFEKDAIEASTYILSLYPIAILTEYLWEFRMVRMNICLLTDDWASSGVSYEVSYPDMDKPIDLQPFFENCNVIIQRYIDTLLSVLQK